MRISDWSSDVCSSDLVAAAEDEAGEPIRGVGARIVENMERSLGVPTATSFRNVPAKLLEVNRAVINGYLGRTRGGKVSFTHLIGYAVVRRSEEHTSELQSLMRISYAVFCLKKKKK